LASKRENHQEQKIETDSQAKANSNNPYKWIMEEFENKNLDKIKRSLLVTLDDLSKGLGNLIDTSLCKALTFNPSDKFR
jgi:hypothetical protein